MLGLLLLLGSAACTVISLLGQQAACNIPASASPPGYRNAQIWNHGTKRCPSQVQSRDHYTVGENFHTNTIHNINKIQNNINMLILSSVVTEHPLRAACLW